MALIITRFTRFGANLGTLHITDARHVEDLDGTDELTVTCKEDLSKGDYLVWRDQQGNWREHIVDVPERWRDEDGTVYTTALCINSIAETWDDWVDEVRPNGSAQVAMERVLASSRWSAGTCTQTGTAHRTFYHKSVRESLQGIVETWGGELETTISCDGTKVTGRSAAIVAARGNQSSAKRFTYTKDLLSIHRRVNSDNPKTRIYAYGRGEELDDSGTYGRRIGIADVNGGIPYVEDTAATAIWGRYDASGNLMPAIGVFIDEECEDPATLKEEAIAYLQRVKEPSVTYEADVIDLAAFGREWEEVALGDTVTIVDKRFSDEGLRLHGRISRLERDLLTNDTSVTFGTLTDVLAGSWASMREQVGYITERTAGVEHVVNPSSGWLDQLISSLNSQYNAAGTYHYSSFEQGEIWSSVPLDENGHATQSGGWAININGMGFRLASSLNADGSWNWRTFGTGEGFTADEITAGVIRGGQSYWNLNTGDFVISSSSTIGGHAPDDFLTDVDVSVEQTSTGANITVNGDTVTLTNGQDGATGPQGPQGAQGIQGEKGADGTSVTVTSIQYGTSASASTQPSSWSTTAPTSITKGKWLWVKTNYSNNTSAITKSYIGTDGDDGTSVYVQSATKSGDTTTVVIKDSDGNTTTLTIKDGEDGTNGTNGTNGKDGTNGANAYIHTAWANSADGTTDFSTTVSAGKLYLGVYTDNTAADSTSPSAYSWTKIKGEQGEKGDKGEKGDAGTSVTVSKIEYGTSTSASSQPSSWSTSAPSSLTKGSWLWVKTTYSNGDSAITKSYVGTDGEDGTSVYVKSSTKSGDTTTIVITDGTNDSTITIKDGEDGENGTNGLTGYVHTAWANSADGTTDFSTTVSAGKTYLGVYTDNTAADSTTPSAYSWSLIKGTGVTSLSPEYYLSTSSTGLVGGSWSAEQQEWQQGHYYWTRQKVTWTDGTTSYTNPVLESALNSANNCALSQHSSGTVINGSGCTIRSITIHGKSVQDGTPTPSAPVPIRSVEALNLYDPSTSVSGYLSGSGTIVAPDMSNRTSDFVPVEAGAWYSFYMHTDDYSAHQPWYCIQWFKSDKTFLSSPFRGWNNKTLGDTCEFKQAPTSAAYVRVSSRWMDDPHKHSSIFFTKGFRFAAPLYGMAVNVHGLNCVDPYWLGAGYCDGSTGFIVPSDAAVAERTAMSIPVTAGDSVMLVVSGCASTPSPWSRYMFMDEDGNRVQTVNRDAAAQYSATSTSYSLLNPVPVPNGAAFLIASFRTYGGTPCIRLDGSNEFVEHQGASTPIDLQGNKLCSTPSGTNGTLGVDSEGNVTLTKRVGAATINGSEGFAWILGTTQLGAKTVAFTTKASWAAKFDALANVAATAKDNVICDRLPANNDAYNLWDGPAIQVWVDDSAAFMICVGQSFSTSADFNTWLQSNPLTVYYPLATPQTISLGKIDLPSLPSPSFYLHVDAAVTPTLDAEWWTVDGIASTGQLSQVASEAAERIGGLEDAVSAINNAGYATRAELEATAAELMPKDNDLFKWLRIVDSTLQIGRETTDGNRFYSSYTADGLGFYAGDSTLPVTALTRELGLYAPRSTIDEQLKIGGFAFIKRSNGNLTLKYIGG